MINNMSKKWIRDNGIYLCEGAPYKDEHSALINPEIRHTMNPTRAMMIYAKSRALGDRQFLHQWGSYTCHEGPKYNLTGPRRFLLRGVAVQIKV